MTQQILIEIITPELSEMIALSETIPTPSIIREIRIDHTPTNAGSTCLIGITQAPTLNNLPPPTEWQNIFTYLSKNQPAEGNKISLVTQQIHLQKLHIPLPAGKRIAVQIYNNNNLYVAYTNICITLQLQETKE